MRISRLTIRQSQRIRREGKVKAVPQESRDVRQSVKLITRSHHDQQQKLNDLKHPRVEPVKWVMTIKKREKKGNQLPFGSLVYVFRTVQGNVKIKTHACDQPWRMPAATDRVELSV